MREKDGNLGRREVTPCLDVLKFFLKLSEIHFLKTYEAELERCTRWLLKILIR